MCKKLVVLLFAAAVLFSGAAIAEVDDSGRLIVPETSVAPVIDGELDDLWQGASEESLLVTDIINATSAVPEDASDLAGTFKVMYDDNNLYFFIEVQDSVLDYQFSDWQGDSVEIFFDGDNSKGSAYDGVNDNQIRINSDDVELGDIGSSLPVDGTVFMVLLTDVGYNIEAAFPLSMLQIVPDNVFGFEVQLNDNDGGGGRETLIRWFSNDNNSWQDASLFGEAILVPEIEPVDPGGEGLVAYYAFENNADDSSGSGLAGTMVGDPVFVEGLADYGMALDFDGIDDVVELGKFDVIGQITLAAWIMADDFEINDARIISKANEWGGNDHWWMLSTISETSLRFRLKTDDGQDTATLISDPVLQAGVWAHVAATWDGSTMRIYKDGAEVASQEKGGTAVAVDPSISVAIGSQPSDAFASDPVRVVKFFDGLIDEAHIYERALSDGELLYLAGERATPVDPGADGLAASYALDNDANDSSGNGHNGTVEGAPIFVAPGWDGTGACMQFGGDSDRITIEPFDLAGSGITLAAWVNVVA
ncbi:MAG: sugar-binding protein, partial [Planctomycetota bacterium]